jgi:hypothetical protein
MMLFVADHHDTEAHGVVDERSGAVMAHMAVLD